MEAHYTLEPDMLRASGRALGTERSPAGRQVLQTLQGNAQLARTIVIDDRDGGDLYQDGMEYARE
jgi:tartrate dehydratase alpha subunit/fumarate hydratase class I-like protein